MMMKALFQIQQLAMLFFIPLVALAGLDEGISAYQKGDYAKAFNEFKPLAEKKDMSSQCALGIMYDKGLGVGKNDKQAFYWYNLAAQQGNAIAQAALGDYYQYGWADLARDDQKEAYWYEQAAVKGNAQGQVGIALLHYAGRGTTQNFKEAVRWLTLAGAQYNEQAISTLATLYINGQGVKKSDMVAYALFNMIGSRDKAALAKRDGLAASLSEDELEQGQALTSELLRPKNFIKTLSRYSQ